MLKTRQSTNYAESQKTIGRRRFLYSGKILSAILLVPIGVVTIGPSIGFASTSLPLFTTLFVYLLAIRPILLTFLTPIVLCLGVCFIAAHVMTCDFRASRILSAIFQILGFSAFLYLFATVQHRVQPAGVPTRLNQSVAGDFTLDEGRGSINNIARVCEKYASANAGTYPPNLTAAREFQTTKLLRGKNVQIGDKLTIESDLGDCEYYGEGVKLIPSEPFTQDYFSYRNRLKEDDLITVVENKPLRDGSRFVAVRRDIDAGDHAIQVRAVDFREAIRKSNRVREREGLPLIPLPPEAPATKNLTGREP